MASPLLNTSHLAQNELVCLLQAIAFLIAMVARCCCIYRLCSERSNDFTKLFFLYDKSAKFNMLKLIATCRLQKFNVCIHMNDYAHLAIATYNVVHNVSLLLTGAMTCFTFCTEIRLKELK